MSILDLQKESHNAIGSHRNNKVLSCVLIFFSSFVAVLFQKVFVHTDVGLPAQLVSRFGIRHAFDYAALKLIYNFVIATQNSNGSR